MVEENVLAWRAVRLHAAQGRQIGAFNALSEALRRLMIKATVNDALTTPLTQIVSAIALFAVITIALWQSQTSGNTVGSFVAFTTAIKLMLIAPLKRLADVMGVLTRGLTSVLRGLELLEHVPQERAGAMCKPASAAKSVLARSACNTRKRNKRPWSALICKCALAKPRPWSAV